MSRAARNFLAALCALLMSAAAVAAEDTRIFYPANSAQPSAPAAGSLGSTTLIVGLVLAAVGGWLVWRGRRMGQPAAAGRALAVEETRSLGSRQYLVVASYEEKRFLLGVCPGRIDLLSALPDKKSRP